MTKKKNKCGINSSASTFVTTYQNTSKESITKVTSKSITKATDKVTDNVTSVATDSTINKSPNNAIDKAVVNSKISKSRWTVDQQMAIDHDGKNILVSAAAGSGKTAVLAERVVSHLLREDDTAWDISRLLIVTFTHAAAEEMCVRIKQRIQKAIDEEWNRLQLLVMSQAKADNSESNSDIAENLANSRSCASKTKNREIIRLEEKLARLEEQIVKLTSADISTMHSFCQKVIRQNFAELDVDPSFRIASDQELTIIKDETLENIFEERFATDDEQMMHLAECFSGDRDDSFLAKTVLKLYEFSCNQPAPEVWLKSLKQPYIDLAAKIDSEVSTDIANKLISMSIWWKPIIEDIHRKTSVIPGYLQEMEPLALELSAASSKIGAAFDNDRNIVNKLLAAVKAENWDDMYAAVHTEFLSMPGGRLNVDRETRTECGRLHNLIKVAVMDLQTNYFNGTAQEILYDMVSIKDSVIYLCDLVETFRAAYTEAKNEKNIIDFNDMEHLTLKALSAGIDENGEFIPSAVAITLQEHYQEIMIDEYQDTNEVQNAIMKLVAGENRGNTFIVGDVKQSIYGFRSSEPSLFLKKYDTFSKYSLEDASAPAELICLKKNFRSRSTVLSGINIIFDQAMQKVPMYIEYDANAALYPGFPYKNDSGLLTEEQAKSTDTAELLQPDLSIELAIVDNSGEAHGYTLAKKKDIAESAAAKSDATENESEFTEKKSEIGGEKLGFADNRAEKSKANDSSEELDEEENEIRGVALEAKYIAKRLRELHDSKNIIFDKSANTYRPVQWRDMVVLLRSVKNSAEVILEELQNLDIPAYSEGSDGYFDAMEIQVILALLGIIDNAHQDIPLAAVLYSPIVGLSTVDLASLRTSVDAVEHSRVDLYSAVLKANNPEVDLSAEIKGKLASFVSQLSDWRRLSRQISVPELIWQLYRDTGFYDFVGGLRGGLLRQANLRMLVTRAEEYEQTDFRGLFRFLRFIERLKDLDTDLSVARTLGESENVVRIMTIHKSKGLEFPIVVVAQMGKKFNLMDARCRIMAHKHLGIGMSYVDAQRYVVYRTLSQMAITSALTMESKAEELRILYVALTRAREKLIMVGNVARLNNGGKDGKSEGAVTKWIRKAHQSEILGKVGKLAESALAEANTYLDWVCPAIFNNRNNIPLDAGRKAIQNPSVYSLEDRFVFQEQRTETVELDHIPSDYATAYELGRVDWKITIVTAEDVSEDIERELKENPYLKVVKDGLLFGADFENRIKSKEEKNEPAIEKPNKLNNSGTNILCDNELFVSLDYSEINSPSETCSSNESENAKTSKNETDTNAARTNEADANEADIRGKLFERLKWQYDFKGTQFVPSKLTVSELKQRFQMAEEQEPGEANVLDKKRSVVFERPEFIKAQAGKVGITGTEYGTLMHSVMEHIDLNGDLTLAGIQQQLQTMVDKEIIRDDQLDIINPIPVAGFFGTEIGQRFIAAPKKWRELPFSRMLQAQKFFDEVQDENVGIFSQGVIDVLFQENDGKLILLDYKTDSDTGEKAVLDRYELQLDLYSQAVEAVFHQSVAEKYLYMLHDGKVIRV